MTTATTATTAKEESTRRSAAGGGARMKEEETGAEKSYQLVGVIYDLLTEQKSCERSHGGQPSLVLGATNWGANQ